jgi:predicted dehydrogenase
MKDESIIEVMRMNTLTRRSFLKNTVAAGVSLAAVPFSKVLGANDTIRIGVVGMNGQGAYHIQQLNAIAGVQVVALCDADRDIIAREKKKFDERGEKVDTYIDVRKLLEDKNIDAISIATPNHWHSLMTIWACQAGKDVYVEKPGSHNIWEGRKMVEAARKYKRIVQHGTQRRSDGGVYEIFDYLHQGSLGKIKCVRGFCYKPRNSIGKVNGTGTIPAGVDYNLWCGPAPMEPLRREHLHYDWHWVWPTGCGDIGNQGVHQMDVCHWLLNAKGLPKRVMSFGGRLGYIDDGETANTQVAILEYDTAPIIFEVQGLPRKKGDQAMDNYRGIRIGEVLECEDGYIAGGWAYDNNGTKIKQFIRNEGSGHFDNFLKAMRSRNVSDLNADIAIGHISSALCHTANTSYRLGKTATGKEIADALGNNDDYQSTFFRFQEHLLVNNVDLEQTPRYLGPWLTMDATNEKYTGEHSMEANMFLTRNYREPFIVPDEV